jgi:twitching motility two-component system response regulator PilG
MSEPRHPSANVAALLQQAIAAAKAGDKGQARPLLIEVTELDPENEAAWMWRASVSLTPKDAAWCLNKVLAINPENKQARDWLEKIRSMQQAAAPPAPATRPLTLPPGYVAPPADPPAIRPLAPPDATTVENRPTPEVGATTVRSEPAPPSPPVGAVTVQAGAVPPRPAPPPIDPAKPTVEAQAIRPLPPPPPSLGPNAPTVAMSAVPPPPSRTLRCVVCAAPSVPTSGKCVNCGAIQSLRQIDAAMNNAEANVEIIRQAIIRFERLPDSEFDADLHFGAAIAYLNLKRPGEALTHLRSASRMRPQDAELAAGVEQVRLRVQSLVPPAATPSTPSSVPQPPQYDRSSSPPSAPSSAPGTRQKIILAVDDSLTVRKIVAMTLEKNGYKVITAADGYEALSKLKETLPDLILLDITMPGMDGYQVCKQIRGNKATKHIPIVMLSGKDGFFDKVQGRLAGAAQYMTKPFEPDALLQNVKKHLKEK